jgi:site-specific recombinase XerD
MINGADIRTAQQLLEISHFKITQIYTYYYRTELFWYIKSN